MRMSTFPLLDQLFDTECNATRVKDPNEFLLLRLERLGDRLDELAYTAFVQAEEYLNELLGDSVECYVERNTDTDLGGAPSMGFRWGVQGQRLNSLSLAAHVDSGSIHATWSCWRNGTSRVRHLWFYEDFPVDGRRFTRTRLLRGVLQLVGKFARRSLSLIPRWHVGSQWWALTPEAVSYLATFVQESQVKRFLRFSKAPDEIYFHTLLAHSPHRHTVESVRGGGVWDAANLHLIDPSLSRWFEASDYEEVVSSGKWFVRKVSTQSSGDLCTRLDGHRTVVEEFGHQTAQPASGESRPPVD